MRTFPTVKQLENANKNAIAALNYKEVKIPFAGFYESIHDANLDNELEDIIDDLKEKGGDESVLANLWRYVDWQLTFKNYIAKFLPLYLRSLESETGLEFHPKKETLEMQSPREYNFITDTLYVKIPLSELKALLEKTLADKERKETFEKRIEDYFTSRDGFISYYSNNREAWGKCEAWDYNQWNALLASYKEDDGEYFGMPDHVEAEIIFNEEGNEIYNQITNAYETKIANEKLQGKLNI